LVKENKEHHDCIRTIQRTQRPQVSGEACTFLVDS